MNKRTLTPKQTQEAKACILRLVQLKHDFMACGMFQTGHALETGVRASGWELAELMENASKARQ